jgi:glycosyltransferase involved in cell wall biosynthesis
MGKFVNERIVGFVEFAAEGLIAGWALDPDDPAPTELALVIDGAKIAAVPCVAPRPDVCAAGLGRGDVGFSLSIPPIFFDGAPHIVQLHASPGRPLGFQDIDGWEQEEWIFAAPPERPISCLDPWTAGDVHCWAVVTDRPSGTTRPADYVIVRQSGQTIATLFPTVARPDVAAAHGCEQLCGFVLPVYRIEGLPTAASLRFHVFPDGSEITGSPLALPEIMPVTIAAPPAPLPAIAPEDIAALKVSGLFDEAYYLRCYPDIADGDTPPFEHFFHFGHREGRWPNLYFDTPWYTTKYLQDEAGAQPLLHFWQIGEARDHQPGPLFDVAWYKTRYRLAPGQNALAHYLANRFDTPLSPNADFDADYYAARYPDVFAAKVDMFDHFFHYGFKEMRNPSAAFDVKFYVQRYLQGDVSVNPLVHYWAHRHEPGVYGKPADDEVTLARELKRFCRPGPHFEELPASPAPVQPQAMLLAYYLPQFHAFPENDAWWGKGFTEWTNIARGAPRFAGHYQPRVPRDLGFYTLDNATMARQIAMARQGGVGGFVFYYYWFNGKRLMAGPIDALLADPSLDIPFALMWANENWTRRWDGADAEVLITQDYLPADDLAMAASFARHFRDPRYIRLQGRPVLMIYRAGIIPDTAAAIARWRGIFQTEFSEDPIFVMAQAFTAEDPRRFGFDGAIEFPPHKLTTHLAPVNMDFTYIDEDFAGAIHRYDDVVALSLDEPAPDFPLIKTALPSWDNDARRQGKGMVITGSTPAKYEAWLAQLVARAVTTTFFGAPIVCVNAWNEWCEGAYLEPDLHFGAAYLNATARAVSGRARTQALPRLVLVGHDAFPAGAQHLLLNIGRSCARDFGVEFAFVLLADGALLETYKAAGPTTVVTEAGLAAKLQALAAAGYGAAIVNTCAAARAVAAAKTCGLRTVLLVHELPRILREKQLTDAAAAGIAAADSVVFPAAFVRDAVLYALGLPQDERCLISPQGSYSEVRYDEPAAARVRAELGLGASERMILGAGYADLRKGFDLFLLLGRLLAATQDGPRTCLVWAGGIDPGLACALAQDVAEAQASGLLIMAGYREDLSALYAAADAFALTSREDPLPSVVIEALSAGLPVAAFARSGGIPDLLEGLGEGAVVPYGDAPAMAAALRAMLDAGISPADRARRHGKIADNFGFADYAARLLDLSAPHAAKISVAVPNYNYARFMPGRLTSIFAQTHPVREVLVLDDASRDDSVAVIEAAAAAAGRRITLIANARNSGSVFAQWRRAAELAQGDFVWIAEADDLAAPAFLATLAPLLANDPDMAFAFSDSCTILGDGEAQWASYKDYYGSIEPGALQASEVFAAPAFAARFMSVKNLILNASAVVWRRAALLAALDACKETLGELKMAGDWWLYLTTLADPKARIGYEAAPLNQHRRHAQSVTHALDAGRHIEEIRRCHAHAAALFALPDDLLARQSAYAAEIAAQLGAAMPLTPAKRRPRRARS